MTCPKDRKYSTACPSPELETYAVGDDVRMAVETSLRVTVLSLIASQVPDDEGLVTRG